MDGIDDVHLRERHLEHRNEQIVLKVRVAVALRLQEATGRKPSAVCPARNDLLSRRTHHLDVESKEKPDDANFLVAHVVLNEVLGA